MFGSKTCRLEATLGMGKSNAHFSQHCQKRLKELRIPDREEAIVQVNITAPKPNRFPDPEADSVK